MATNIGGLVANLGLNTASFNRNLEDANRKLGSSAAKWNKTTARAQRGFDRFNKSIKRTAKNMVSLNGAAVALGSALSARKVIQYADTWKNLEGRLKLVTSSQEDLTNVQEQLFEIAQKTRNAFEGTADLYARFARSTSHLGFEQAELLKVTETVNKAITVSGASAASAGAALFQLSQGLAADALRGQELNSVLEQTPRLAQAIADGMGVAVGELRSLAQSGALTAETVLNAISSQARVIDEEFKQMPKTVSQAFVQLDNAFLRFIGKSELINRGTNSLTAAISTLAQNFDKLATAISLVSAVIAGRFAGSLTVAAAGMAVAIQQSIAYQATLARMAGVSAAAAAATGTLAVATRGLTLALGVLGGPVGLAVTAALVGLTLHTNIATEAQAKFSQELAQVNEAVNKAITQEGKLTSAVKENVEVRIQARISEMESIARTLEWYTKLGAAAVGGREILGKIGIGTAPSEQIELFDKTFDQIRDLREILDRSKQTPVPKPKVSGVTAATKSTKQANEALQKQREILRTIKTPLEEYNEKLAEARKLLSLDPKDGGINIEQFNRYQEELREQFEQSSDSAVVNARIIKDSFGDALESAIFDFENFGDSVTSVLDGIARDIARRTIIDPFTKSVSDAISGSVGTDFFSDIFGGFFAAGGRPPIGKASVVGENGPELFIPDSAGSIIPNHQLASGSAVGGGNIEINLINAPAQPNVSETQTANGRRIDIEFDAIIAEKLSTPGTLSNQALSALNQRSFIRR